MEANVLPETKQPYTADERTRRIATVLDAMDELAHRMAGGHTDEFLEIDITMPQAKTLFLVATEGQIRMSVLAARLAVTLSTVSGLVDRLVDAGLVSRHDDPADRRQVVVAITSEGAGILERFRDLNRRQLTDLLSSVTDRDLETVSRATTILARAAEQMSSKHPAASGPGSIPAASTTRTASTTRQAERDRS